MFYTAPSTRRVLLVHPGLCRLNIAVLLLLHQTLPGPSTNRTALNRMEVKLVFYLRFEVPLHSQETLPLNYKLLCSPFTITYHLLLLRVSLPSFILAFSSYFLLFDTVIISHAHSAHSYLSCLYLSLPLCDSLHIIVLTVTMLLSGVLHVDLHVGCCLHLQAILLAQGKLSCGWLSWEQMFLVPLVGGKALKATP